MGQFLHWVGGCYPCGMGVVAERASDGRVELRAVFAASGRPVPRSQELALSEARYLALVRGWGAAHPGARNEAVAARALRHLGVPVPGPD